jgi:hypothetical protein
VEDDPPVNDLGLTIVVDPGAKRNIDLVFIHGLGGMSQTTWSHDGKPEHFWPKEWLPQERGMETARIMIWGYHAPSNPFSVGTTMNISRFATDLLNALVMNHAGRVSNHFISLRDPMTIIFKGTSDRLCVPQYGRINSEAGERIECLLSFF